jgi:translation elongation factor EF-Ts
LDKWCQQICLLDQFFIKNQDKWVNDYITAVIAMISQTSRIGRFARFQIGA